MKVLTLAETTYTLGPIRAKDAKTLFSGEADQNIALVAASLRAGGDETASAETVGELPLYAVFQPLLEATLDVNGLRTGEAKAATEAA